MIQIQDFLQASYLAGTLGDRHGDEVSLGVDLCFRASIRRRRFRITLREFREAGVALPPAIGGFAAGVLLGVLFGVDDFTGDEALFSGDVLELE